MVKYYCKPCNYKTDRKSSYERHLTASRHDVNVKNYKPEIKKDTEIKQTKNLFKCGYCDMTYVHQRSMKRHMNACSKKSEYISKYNNSIIEINKLKQENTELHLV